MTHATYLRTAVLPLDQLAPFPGNAKRGAVPTILESLRRNGQYRALVVRELPGAPLVVLAGNHTAEALGRHGAGDCDLTVRDQPCGVCGNDPAWAPAARCEVVACDEDTARRINLVDNRSADLGAYDTDALVDLLSFLDEDYGATGYQEADVLRLLEPPPSLEELADTYRPPREYDPDDRPGPHLEEAEPRGRRAAGDTPDDGDMWPVLRLRVPPRTRDLFYDLTRSCPTPDETSRFQYLLDLAARLTQT